jgi:organic hydroperoxide reductase OsmC/OhrA
VHRYTARVGWSGSTATGYDTYDRRHMATVGDPGGLVLPLSADATFRGDPACPNPEQLLVLAASSCQLLSFLAVAARARLDVVDYRDDAYGVMPEAGDQWVTEIVLSPRIVVVAAPDGPPVTAARVEHLCEVAHRQCYIAASLRSEVRVEPEITIRKAS